VALKKPSDFFGNNKKTPLDEVKEEYIAASPKKIEQVSEAFDVFKSNLNHIQSLSDFTSTFDSFKENLEKVENVSSEVVTIKDEIKNLIKQEDLDSAMMAQLLFVEESISKIESKISSINSKTVDQIKEDFKGLSTSVEGFLSVDVPKYKKLISESEVRVDDRFGQFKDKVEESLDTVKADVNKEVTIALSEVEKLNTDVISEVKEDFRKNTKEVKNLVEEELPKYRKFFAETELKTEETIKNAIDSYKETIENLNAKVKVFTETEIPKYNNLLIETKLKSEEEVKQLEEEVLSKVNSLSEKIDFISGDVTEKTAEKIEELQTVIDEYKEEIDSISKTYSNLYKDFKKREISDNEKLESYSNEIEKYNKRFNFLEETVTEDLREIQSVLINSNETYHAALKTEVGKFRNNISEQMKGLQMDLVVNEQHIKKQNDNIETVKEEIKEVLERLQLDTLEEKNKELVEKIAYLEETISEINEKKLLTEDNPTLPGDPSTNNSRDPLTPLDQKFATLDDLQNHYRTFINRIQQQIATIGGGGAGFIKDLDDVTFNESTGENQLLIYNGSKWVGIASTALGSGGGGGSTVGAAGTWAVSSAGIHTTKNVGVATTARSDFALYVGGDQYVDGNITIGGTITYEDVKNVDSIGIVTARNGINVLAGGINVSGVATATKVHVGVDTGFFSEDLVVTGDARVTGILTVGTGSITLDGDSDVVTVGTGITITGSTGKIEATEIRTVGTTGAFYPPCLTTTQRDALSVTEGAMIFNKTTKKMEFYDGTSWIALPGMTLGLSVALDG
jgi:DNA repair exonuclease SbcCD ATPase subunit